MTQQRENLHTENILIEKSSGEMEKFDATKLCRSIEISGAPPEVAEDICQHVTREIKPGVTSGTIWRNALRYLVREDLKASARYSLRRGMAHLGPDGFVFERFVEVLLQAHGYKTKRNQMVRGASGLEHEVDILATKDNRACYVEAKYKNEYGMRTHVDDVMYAWARFEDILEGKNKRKKHNESEVSEVWLVTNTEFTVSSITYGHHKGMHLLGWDYPNGQSLEDMIVDEKVYPLTILPSVTRNDRKALMAGNVMLAQDLIPYSGDDLIKKFGVSPKRADNIIREVHEIMKPHDHRH